MITCQTTISVLFILWSVSAEPSASMRVPWYEGITDPSINRSGDDLVIRGGKEAKSWTLIYFRPVEKLPGHSFILRANVCHQGVKGQAELSLQVRQGGYFCRSSARSRPPEMRPMSGSCHRREMDVRHDAPLGGWFLAENASPDWIRVDLFMSGEGEIRISPFEIKAAPSWYTWPEWIARSVVNVGIWFGGLVLFWATKRWRFRTACIFSAAYILVGIGLCIFSSMVTTYEPLWTDVCKGVVLIFVGMSATWLAWRRSREGRAKKAGTAPSWGMRTKNPMNENIT